MSIINIIKNKKYDIFKFPIKKNGKINFFLNEYNDIIGFKGIYMKYYNFDYIFFPPNLNKKNNNNMTIDHNINLLFFFNYLKKNKDLYYVKSINNKYKFFFLKSNSDHIIRFLYIKKQILSNIKIFKSYEYNINNSIIKLILEYIYLKLLHNKKHTIDNEIYIKLFYQYYVKYIEAEVYLLYNKKYSDFANYKQLYDFLNKNGYINYYYKKLVPIIKKNYKKVLNNIDFSGIKEFKKQFIKDMKPFSKININKIIDEYYPNKKQNKIIKDKLKELIKKLNV